MSNPIQTPPESYLINSPEVQEVIHKNVTKDMIWQPSSIVGQYDKGTIVWFSDDRYVKKNNNANNDTPPQDNTDDWMHISDYVAELFNIGYPSKMPQLEENLLALLGAINNLDQNQTTLQAELNTAKQTIQVLTERTKNFHKTNLVETDTGEEILVNVDNMVFTNTNNVCKYPSPKNKPLERWICYVNEEADNTLWVKNIDTDGWGDPINFIPSSCPRMLSETEIIYIEKTTDRIRRKNINILGNGNLVGPSTATAKYIAPAYSKSILFSQKGTVPGALDGDLMLLTSPGSVVKILNQAKASYVYYRQGFYYYVNNNLNNFQAYRKANGTAETNDAGTKMTGFADSSPDAVANIFSVGDNMLCFTTAGGFIYLKRDNEPNCIAEPIGIKAGRKLYGGCDLGGGEIIFFKETATAGDFSMYRKKIFEYI